MLLTFFNGTREEIVDHVETPNEPTCDLLVSVSVYYIYPLHLSLFVPPLQPRTPRHPSRRVIA